MSAWVSSDQARVGVCFHGIGRRQRKIEDEEAGYWVSRDQFLAILDEVAAWPCVDLSFDDGNASDVEIALPELRERGLAATFYVLAGRLDTGGSLGAQDLTELVRSGMQVGSHGWDHVPWTGLDDAGVRRELVDARSRLSDLVGKRVDRAALPFGRYDRRLLGHLRRIGYASVSTSDRAWARPGGWLLPRFSVHAADTAESLRATARAARSPQARAYASAKESLKRLR